MARLDEPPLTLEAASSVMDFAPLGPSRRRFANAAAVISTVLDPPALLRHLKAMEHGFGRRGGRRWGARTIDLDIILWSGGMWRQRALRIPHAAFRGRAFVLQPLAAIAPEWRDVDTGLRMRHLAARLRRRKPVDRVRRPL
jgi:2-amino-4-hydroxy-6-hydroxymethyldihydropteridine diphosphokinase